MEFRADTICLEGDSNAIILPAKRNGKNKDGNKEGMKANSTPKLSKSQKRKLKKLEEEKQREILLSKSIKTLEKFKIPESAFSLLRSSKNISRVETVKEKRRMAIQMSKARLDVLDGGPVSKRIEDDVCGEAKAEMRETQVREDAVMQSTIVEREMPNCVSAQPTCHQGTLSGVKVGLNEISLSAVSPEKFPHKGKADESSCLDSHQAKNVLDSSLRRPLMTPTVVHVLRSIEVENKRKDLPIVMMEQEIMEAVNEHSTIIICGETGCGKTTQVPQFLYEAGFGSYKCSSRSGVIGVTQPRRVAVLATAKRVAFELGFHLGKEVGFQVRHDKKVGDGCSIKFMTDGILLREVQNDILLRRYSVIILDEAHERSLNTDILIGMLSRVICLRQKTYEDQQKMILSGKHIDPEGMIFPLKLILMSATLRVEDFVSGRKLFQSPPPIIEVPRRQFPVTLHFSKRTDIVDYIGQAYKKVLSIHKRLPQGGILVFVTGQREVEYLCQKLRKASRKLTGNLAEDNKGGVVADIMNSIQDIDMKDIDEAFEIQGNFTDLKANGFSSYDANAHNFSDDESDLSHNSETESELEISGDDMDLEDQLTLKNDSNLRGLVGEEGDLTSLKAAFEALAGKTSEDSKCEGQSTAPEDSSKQLIHVFGERKGHSLGAMHVLPLYAMLPPAAQLRVFEKVNEGERLVIVATNVAETSLTIPGIKYVVDTGREKVKNYNPSNGMETYEVQWISKASAAQRAGRAGRTMPGHCYRLYSSAVFNNILPDFSCPEICKVPVESIVLILKSMSIDKVQGFPFPTLPEASALVEAEGCLKTLEALDDNRRLTPLGRAMAYYPISPRHSRMLLTVIQIMRKTNNYARANLVLGYAVAAAAALSLPNPFVMQFERSHSDGSSNNVEHNGRSVSQDGEQCLDKETYLRKKKLKESSKGSFARFSNPSSDALTVAYALQCFELSGNSVKFCDENALHLKTMEEMSKLRKQLLRLIFDQNVKCSSEQDFSWNHGKVVDIELAWNVSSGKNPLLLNEEQILGRAICAGWADRVAKRVKGYSGSSEGDSKANAIRYQACMVKEVVFLHRRSSLSSSSPEFLVYNELLHTKRPYMHGATSVKPEWLVQYARSLCSFSAVEDPKPYYECHTDQVFCWVVPTFGPHLWHLPLHSRPITGLADRVKVFAYALLDGQILPCLRSVKKFMAARPTIILDREAAGERRVGNLILKLKIKSIDSCVMLREVWNYNPMELYSEIEDWFKKSFKENFQDLWDQMRTEIQLEPQERFPKKAKNDDW
ncbi:hypothetical protein K2173_011871 [Erythroxylum novogranatense]|uniref:RNA helicase n=1 Tax=Erythroxylum novogranatense TaxID=1862640 RepID=A0AAV8T184_9ROSI|nr:hypothetical protein K2173_011871 [Erythroxylum novogranatense]